MSGLDTRLLLVALGLVVAGVVLGWYAAGRFAPSDAEAE